MAIVLEEIFPVFGFDITDGIASLTKSHNVFLAVMLHILLELVEDSYLSTQMWDDPRPGLPLHTFHLNLGLSLFRDYYI